MKTKNFINSLLVILIIYFFAGVNSLYAQNLTKINKKNFKKAEKAIKKENYEGALNFYSTIIKTQPKHFLSLKGIADIYYKYYDTDKKNYDIAFKNYTKAIKHLDIFLNTLKKRKKKYYEYLSYKKECENNLIYCERELQSSKNKPVNVNNNTKEKETNTSEKYTDITSSYDFISPEFIKFKEKSREQQIEQIQEEVGKEYDKLDSTRQLEKIKTYEEIKEINDRWLKEKKNKEDFWYNNLKELESSYLQKLTEFNKIVYTIKRLNMELDIKEKEIKNLEKEIKNYYINLKMNIKYRDSLIVSELNLKLTTIPKSIVLIGRFEIPEASLLNEAKQNLLEKMGYWATQQKEGYFISNAIILNNGKYNAISEQTVTGINQICSKYYKNIQKGIWVESLKRTIDYYYQIAEIEVYRRDIKKNSNNQNKYNLHEQENNTIDVFKVDNNKVETFINVKDNTPSKMRDKESHDFNNEEIDYIKNLINSSKKRNEKYTLQFDDAEKDYKKKFREYEKIIKKIKTKIESLKQEKEKKEKIYTKQTNDLSENKILKIKKEQEYNRKQIVYENYYKNKLGYTNKLIYIDAGSMGIDKEINKYNQLVSKTYKAVDELWKISNKTTIFKEYKKGEVNKFVKVHNEINSPEATSFKIISLNKITSSDNNEHISLNIAYKVNWKIKPSLIIQKIPERLIQISETEDSIKWRIYKKESTSYIDYMDDVEIQGETHLRLPSINELRNLFQALAQEKRLAGKDKLIDMRWIDFIRHPLLSNSKVISNNKEYYNCIKITDNSKYEYKIIEKEDGEFVSIILIED